jgi:hypothetical protein
MGSMNEGPAYGLSFPLYVLGLLVIPERDEAAVPQVCVLGPFDKLKLPDECGFSHRHSAILAAVRPAPHFPAFFSGRFAKGHPEISSSLSFLKSSARDAGVNPFRVRAPYISFDPS